VLFPRGLPAPNNPGFAGDWIMNSRAWLIGANLPGLRAHDIVNAVSTLARRDDVDASDIRAEARGIAGIWLLLAAATDPRIKAVTVYSVPYSLRAALEEELARDLHDAAIPGFVLRWDLSAQSDLGRPNRLDAARETAHWGLPLLPRRAMMQPWRTHTVPCWHSCQHVFQRRPSLPMSLD
jgi:hypothetical protein